MLELNATDRCDRCGAQAYHKASKAELEMLFCNHHEREHESALVDKGWTIESVVEDTYSIPVPVLAD